ncbi:hypothetical protein ACHAXR_010913 [Thalassiosira sp. AJA248-18]
MDQKKAAADDAFIGIDIDIEPPENAGDKARRSSSKRAPMTLSKTGTSRKRPRPPPATTAAAAERKRPKKPKPPPNPPSSLVSLLQKDSSVRSYFQSLQENLDYDVDKWKHEAARWKRLASSSPPPSLQPKKNRSKSRVAGKKVQRGAAKQSKPSLPQKLELKNDKDDGSTIPITDEALFGDEGSDGSSHCSGKRDYVVPLSERKSPLLIEREDQYSQATSSFETERRSHILEKLKEAKKCLDILGVSLVEVEVKSTVMEPQTEETAGSKEEHDNGSIGGGILAESETTAVAHTKKESNDSMADVNNLHTTDEENVSENVPSTLIERILHRQSDEKVAAEMMASLRKLIKASLFVGSHSHDDLSDGNPDEGKDENGQLSPEERMHRCRLRRRYHPFCRDGQLHVPSVYYSNNPGRSDELAGEDDGATTIMPQHPASIGLKHLINILSIMDTYCSDGIEDDDWNAIFACDGNRYGQTDGGNEQIQNEDMASLQIGMRNRCRLAERVVSSLDVEITRVWALTDRATNLATTSIHFHPADVIDMDDPENANIQTTMYGEKSYNRLATLEETISHARIATLLHRGRGNLQKAAELVVGYIISSAPSLGAEPYPKLPPVLSFCVLEALLSPEHYVPRKVENLEGEDQLSAVGQGWFQEYIRHMFNSPSRADETVMHLLKTLAYPVHVAASIWRERSLCADDRVRDVALIELAAYERIQSFGTWLTNPTVEMMNFDHITKLGVEILSSATSILLPKNDGNAGKMRMVSGISCIISLLTLGDVDRIIQLCDKILLGVKSGRGRTLECSLFLLPACCSAYSSIKSRKWESMKLGNVSGRHTAAAFTVQDNFSHLLDTVTQHMSTDDWLKIDIISQCCVLLGDGRRLQRLVITVLPDMTHAVLTKENSIMTKTQRALISRTMASLIDAGETPTVRVINLKRRPDRALDFMECAVHKEQLIVVNGPSKLRRKSIIAARKNAKTSFIGANGDMECHGDFAFDGQCSRDELENQLVQRLDGKGTLSDFVKAKWRPSELKAFDRDAREDFELVNTSMTEKACTLSHIASWMGVESTLSEISSIARRECELFLLRFTEI